jgi:hypothetical protein
VRGYRFTDAAADAHALCEALGLAIEGTKDTPSDHDERLLDRETLAIKCLFHARSCLFLAAGTPLGRGALRVLDLSSINVLVRATLESSLSDGSDHGITCTKTRARVRCD